MGDSKSVSLKTTCWHKDFCWTSKVYLISRENISFVAGLIFLAQCSWLSSWSLVLVPWLPRPVSLKLEAHADFLIFLTCFPLSCFHIQPYFLQACVHSYKTNACTLTAHTFASYMQISFSPTHCQSSNRLSFSLSLHSLFDFLIFSAAMAEIST